jgi:hypothetical protein
MTDQAESHDRRSLLEGYDDDHDPLTSSVGSELDDEGGLPASGLTSDDVKPCLEAPEDLVEGGETTGYSGDDLPGLLS